MGIFNRKKYSKQPQKRTYNGKTYVRWSSHKTKADAKKSADKWRGTRRTRVNYMKTAKKPYSVYIGPTKYG